jgi:hypothetical protein
LHVCIRDGVLEVEQDPSQRWGKVVDRLIEVEQHLERRADIGELAVVNRAYHLHLDRLHVLPPRWPTR